MNLCNSLTAPSKILYRIGMKCRRLLPRQVSQTFGFSNPGERPKIERIYVINLDRQPDRWIEMGRELGHVLDSSRAELGNLTERYPAIDARDFTQQASEDGDIDPFYTLRDQLFVEPQPRALPDRLELDRPIRMSRPEIAVAHSHIGVWRRVAASKHSYALVLEDDVWFEPGFARHLDQAWDEIEAEGDKESKFDVLYLSYKEVKHGAQKTFISRNVFRPVRGLWFLSGYVLSRGGARKLLRLLPCRGPVDLWINHQFGALDVRAIRRSIISQRRDGSSTNLYSILPSLTKIGVIDSEGSSLFQIRPTERPVFVFGSEGSGLSSLAMALSMLGYRCCSDLEELPNLELEKLLAGGTDRVFDAYVNIGALTGKVRELRERYPQAKFIITKGETMIVDNNHIDVVDDFNGSDVVVLHSNASNKWQVVCEHLKCAPPVCSFPEFADFGQRRLSGVGLETSMVVSGKVPKRDRSPWVIESRQWWRGIRSVPTNAALLNTGTHVRINDRLVTLDMGRWLLRDDTFAGNLALFRPSNVEFRAWAGAVLSVRKEPLGVRDYSAASISSRDRYSFGRFEAVIQASNVPGVVTGFFLHRDSPRQEIDIEIVGNRTDRLLVNVFYNPGGEGARFDYGYRGAPSYIELGFDASQSAHQFAIKWDPCEIRWLVDNQLVHSRANWDPTPIPNLPMTLHVNTWPSRSKELAGRLTSRRLPATTVVKSIALEATVVANQEKKGLNGVTH
jgi:GR25 family glycosyltransferase involved in LPS biosynthesis